MAKLDTAGTYRGELVEAGLGETRNGYPQFVGRFRATEKYIEELSELQHFYEQGVIESRDGDGKTFDAQWVDWSTFDEYITGFLVLFNNAEEFSEGTKLLNYDQLQAALEWDGLEFESLNDDTHVGKQVLFRVEEDEYNGQTQLKVNWIDAPDASPNRELRKLDDDKVKGLQAKLKMGGKKQAAKPAKASKPAEKPAEKPSSNPPKKSPPKKDAEPEQQEEAKQEEAEEQTESSEPTSLPASVSQDDAWEFVCTHKGDNADSDVEDAWIAACNEIGEDKDEDNFTEEEWAKVRDIVIRDLALDV